MARQSLIDRGQWLPVAATILFTALLTALLAYGMRRASQLQSASAALQTASELSAQPQLLRSELTLIQRGLESASFVGDSIRNINEGRAHDSDSFRQLSASIGAAGLQSDPAIASALAAASSNWSDLDLQLQALSGVQSRELYTDTATGSVLTGTGQLLQRSVNRLLTAQANSTRLLSDYLTQLSAALRQVVVRSGSSLRILLLAGTALAAMLLAMMLYFALRARASGAAARDAQRQVDNILGTVREGLFLIDRDGRIGSAHSASLSGLLHNPAPAGQSMEDMLRPMVDPKTLIAATKYLNLLWKNKVNEELIEAVNPLHQIAVSFLRPQGGHEIRYLSFAFRRARDASDYLLGAVADVTDRVTLQQELEQLKSDSDTSGNLLMQMLKVDPAQLEGFLAGADRAFHNSNALLTAPGKEQSALREKLDGVFRELHTVKGEAAALGLEGFARRIHAAEDILSDLRTRTELKGSDFVSVVTHLDELISHAAELTEARVRVTAFSQHAASRSAPASNDIPVAHAPSGLESLLKSLTAEVSRASGRNVQLRAEGLDAIPATHERRVRDICVQMVRNSIVHGVESPEQRASTGKPPGGNIRVSFSDSGKDEYSLLVEDDGQGLSYERILNRALQLELVKPAQVMNLDRAAIFRLIFSPGFSTVEEVTDHAGRGVGLDAVNALVRDSGGRIGISTAPGQFTRFKIVLPKALAMGRQVTASGSGA